MDLTEIIYDATFPEYEQEGQPQHKEFLKAIRLDARPLWTVHFAAALNFTNKPDTEPPLLFATRVIHFAARVLRDCSDASFALALVRSSFVLEFSKRWTILFLS